MRDVRTAHAMAGQQGAVSLLWPPGCSPDGSDGGSRESDAATDLGLTDVAQALTSYDGYRAQREQRERFVFAVLTAFYTDLEVITYRQAVVTELIENRPLRERLHEALPGLTALSVEPYRPVEHLSVQQVARRLSELGLYMDVVVQLRQVLDTSSPRAPAFLGLQQHLREITGTPEFLALRAELPRLRATLDEAKSITIGVNLSVDLVPESATILSINVDKIEGRHALLGRLLGEQGGQRGITPLQTGNTNRSLGQQNGLVRDLAKLLEEVAAPVAEAIRRYTTVNTRALVALEFELSFFLQAVTMIESLHRAGLPMCRPEVAPIGDRITELVDGYNVSLALQTLRSSGERRIPAGGGIVPNTITFGKPHRVWILTGPNSGGKTTYTRAVGLAHYLLQAGLYVPASTARMSPVDAIYTHFATLENPLHGSGRLGEEAERLARIFHHATPHSLILLNEVLSGTSAIEALGMAIEAVRGLRLLGARAIYVTHLHDLAARVEEVNAHTPGTGSVGSLVARVDDGQEPGDRGAQHRRTYRITPGPPPGLSYASEIAEKYGISFSQLEALLRQRGVLEM